MLIQGQKIAVREALTQLRRRRWRDISLEDLVADNDGTEFTKEVLIDKGTDTGQAAIRGIILATLDRLIFEELTDR